jgi:hypothetical protein
MVEILDANGCCGVREFHGISQGTPTQIIKDFATLAEDPYNDSDNFAHVFFTQAGKRTTYGTRLAEYIKRLDLGSVVSTPVETNPNSGNPLKMFVWTVNWKALREKYPLPPQEAEDF